MRRRLPLLLLLLLLLLVHAPPANAQSGLRYLFYDVDITVGSDGTLLVEETQTIRFDGEYSQGFAQIPREFSSQIEVLGVFDTDGPYEFGLGPPRSFGVENDRDFVYVDWNFPPTRSGDIRTFFIQYRVSGGLFVYPQENRLDWELIPADRSGLTVESSKLTVRFDRPVTDAQYEVAVEGAPLTSELVDGVLELRSQGPIPDGDAVKVVIIFDPALTPNATVQPWQETVDAANLDYDIPEWSANLTITAAGQVVVEETQTVAVRAGTLASGFRVLSLRQLDGIGDVAVAEGEIDFLLDEAGCINCFRVEVEQRQDGWVFFGDTADGLAFDPARFGSVTLLWDFPVLVAGDTTRFTLRYTALNALQIGEEQQRLGWTVIPDDNPTVQQATLFLTLPPGIGLEDVTIEGGAANRLADGRLAIVHGGPVPAGDGWEVFVTMPAGATTAEKSLWQQDLELVIEQARAAAAEAEAARQAAEARRARWQLAAGGLTLLIGLGGLLGVLQLWYRAGRDPEPLVEPPERISEPPSALPAGVVAYLLDEELDGRGLTASLFELAELGLVSIPLPDDSRAIEVRLNYTEPLPDGAELADEAGEPVTVPPHLVRLFNLIQAELPAGSRAGWSHLLGRIRPHLPAFYALLGHAAAPYFAESPDVVRSRWRRISEWMVIGGLIGAVVTGLLWRDNIGGWAAGPMLAVALVGVALWLVHRALPRRTPAGVREADLWRAYRRFLLALREADGAAASQVLQRDFAYAVALDVVEVVVDAVAPLNPPPPIWTRPVLWRTLRTGPHDGDRLPMPSPQEVNLPDGLPAGLLLRRRPGDATNWSLDQFSNILSGSLENANRSATGILNAAVDAAEEMPFELVVRGAGNVARFSWKASTTTAKIAFDIMAEMASSGGGGGYSGGSSFSGGGRSRSRSSFSSRSSSRSSSSRRSSGGRRGFR